jgi:hypothetical protein
MKRNPIAEAEVRRIDQYWGVQIELAQFGTGEPR